MAVHWGIPALIGPDMFLHLLTLCSLEIANTFSTTHLHILHTYTVSTETILTYSIQSWHFSTAREKKRKLQYFSTGIRFCVSANMEHANLACLFIFLASIREVISKENNNHDTSWHSYMALLVIIFITMSQVADKARMECCKILYFWNLPFMA